MAVNLDLASKARAIVWVQWRTRRNFYPRSGAMWSLITGAIWYGMWVVAAVIVARVMASPASLSFLEAALPGALLLLLLYWQVVPLLLAATGAGLDLRKLLAYPIPPSQLFGIEVLLRVTASIEMALLMAGCGVGVAFNPALPGWAPLAVVPFVLFNLFLAAGLRDIITRVLANKRVREAAFFLLILAAALPRFLATRAPGQAGPIRTALRQTSAFDGWPWTATANLLQGRDFPVSSAVLLLWTFGAAVFARWQFSRTLNFDAQAAGASHIRPSAGPGLMESLYRLPAAVFRDPLGALIEKEFRFLVRAPRFRLVFLMGFTFGLIIWLPFAAGAPRPPDSFMNQHYLTVVSVYALLLLGEVCFWNSFGFDRSAAQIYFLAPVSFARVLIAKNLTALFFILVEIGAIALVCSALGMPLSPIRLAEALAVALVLSIFLLGAGNLVSVHLARGVNPENSFRRGSAGRLQAMLLLVYPVAFLPVGLAYLARYAFDTQLAFYAVLAFDALLGMVMYKIALDSAVGTALERREQMIAALSEGDGPISS